jgi:transcriptional regulator
VERLVRDLTARHESTRVAPWSLDDAPPDFVNKQLRAIVGIEVTVDRWEGKRKLSQNRSEHDHSGVVQGLIANGDARSLAVAEAMDRPLT